MTRKNTSNINLLMKSTKTGMLLTSKWLMEHGISNKLVWWYAHSGWLEKVANKLYKKSSDTITWPSVVAVLQQQLNLPVHVGGKTAIQLLGKAHYVAMQPSEKIDLYMTEKVKLPDWLNKISGCHTSFNIFSKLVFKDDGNVAIVKREFENFAILLSAPERAMMEILADIPKQHTYEEAYLIMENLAKLRPQVVQLLLEKCCLVKVKRLFLHLTEKCQHNWLAELDLNRIDLGHGKRKIGTGGIYDAKYQLSVPKMTTE
jgi:hypothetical protein